MAAELSTACDGDAAAPIDLVRTDDAKKQSDDLPLTLSECGFASDSLDPAAQVQDQQQCQRGDGDTELDDFPVDELLFLLEEEQEELLLPGLSNEPMEFTDLDLLNDATGDDSHKHRRHEDSKVMSPTPCIVSASQATLASTRWAAAVVSSQAADSTDPTAIKAPKGTRKRVKDELEYLRQHVVDLEDQLQQLKPKHANSSSSSQLMHCGYQVASVHDEDDFTSAPALLASSSSLWKRVASHQLDERRKTEAENTRLRDLLEAQLRLARSLARTLRKRPNLADLESERSAVQLRRLDPHGSAELNSIFTHLEESIDGLYPCVDAVLLEAGLSSLKREICDNQVKTDATGRLFIEVVASGILPFDLATTSASFWKLFSRSSDHERHGVCSVETVDVMSDTLSAQFSTSLSMQRTDAVLIQGHMLGRRFVEESRVVFVWIGLGKSESNLFGSDQVVVRETGWTVIEAIPSEDGEVSTIIQTIIRVIPDVGSLDADAVSESQLGLVGVLTELVLSTFRQNFGTMQRMVENIVMAEMTS